MREIMEKHEAPRYSVLFENKHGHQFLGSTIFRSLEEAQAGRRAANLFPTSGDERHGVRPIDVVEVKRTYS